MDHGKLTTEPDRATISVADKPLLAKLDMRVLMFEKGDGMSELAALRFAVNESRLPNFTLQLGPPNCKSNCVFIIWNPSSITKNLDFSLLQQQSP